ncbi:MAG: ATP-dependent DNA helicase [Desulfobacteraceae bacterium]|nr:ATP-dependent DNA helicase [Desulfobacteraceae bacterium]
MNIKKTFKVSVKDLITATQQKNDLAQIFVSRTRTLAGIMEHARIQAMRPEGYKKEVSISTRVDHDLFFLDIFGRIDGMLDSQGLILVEEIKTTRLYPDLLCNHPLSSHMAQLKCYGHMITKKKKLAAIDLQLTYSNPLSKKICEHKKNYSARDLKLFFDQTITAYIAQLETDTNWALIRNRSIKNLTFPYDDFRTGQRELAEAVYKIIKNKKILFARAPTGTGKTIATLYPAIKSLGLGQIDKIFYLTAKTPGRTVAIKALKDLKKNGARLKSVILTAKQKICFMPDKICDMDVCPYAQAYYTKLNQAMVKIIKHELFDQDLLETIGQTYQICPFELSLDISLVCDIIVCDLNYAFDPRVYLKRYFDKNAYKITFLIDEAHNLPDRLRSMYSADLLKSDILKTQKLVRDIAPELSKSLVTIHKELSRLKKKELTKNKTDSLPHWAHDPNFKELTDLPENYMKAIEQFVATADLWLDKHPNSPIRAELIDFYFMTTAFLTIARFFDNHYRFFIEKKDDQDINTRLFCMDPSRVFSRLIQRGSSAILFSATFFPTAYYQTILFGSKETPNNCTDENKEPKTLKTKESDKIIPYSIVLPSPFPKKNFKLMIHSNIQTTYKTRQHFFKEVARVITLTVNSKPGNYMVFFPSYAYMNHVVKIIEQENQVPGIQIQAPRMTELERENFLYQFTPQSQITGFAVMGGIFGEGIDLEGPRLIGVIVVGVGLPQICPEQNQIRAYYEARNEDGFFNAYQMPGFNRVMQATGRLIRRETDRGVVILIDERFTRTDYKNLFPEEWYPHETISNCRQLTKNLKAFWKSENYP